MIEIYIPGFGQVKLKYLVTDFTGTLSVDGKLCYGIDKKINYLATLLKIFVLTADTFGTVKKELSGINCDLVILEGKRIDLQKKKFVENLGAEYVISFGNGKNDRFMLKISKIGVAVMIDEGCSLDAIKNADILVKNIHDAFDLLINRDRLKATLRF